ncbi:MAG: DNA methyltransferase, partial [Candidatus Caldarchaeum sp.]
MSTVNALLPDPSWAFAELTQKQTGYVTHSYHRYPAKFIPQLAARLISEYSAHGDLVVDPFMGSGTTLVEAKLLGRPSLGTDINPVAHLIARAKTTAIEPERLACAIGQLRALLRELSNDGQL